MSTKNRGSKKTTSARKRRKPAVKNATADRAVILRYLKNAAGPQTLDDLIGGLGLQQLRKQRILDRELQQMLEVGTLQRNKRGAYRLPKVPRKRPPADRQLEKGTDKPAQSAPAVHLKPGAIVEGPVSLRGEGYGFVAPPAGQNVDGDIFLPTREMQGVLDGDSLRVRVTEIDAQGRLAGCLLKILETDVKTVVGRLHAERQTLWLIPSNPRNPELPVAHGSAGKAKQGQVVVAEVLRPAGRNDVMQARVREILGDHLGEGVEIEAAIREHGIPNTFSDATLKQARALGDRVPARALQGRRDLRELPLVTIDGADARDFDDAVCAQRMRSGGWKLWVAIADVSHYVKIDSALDADARERGTSVYFPERVVPMLPESLSNGLCSLNPDVNRLCMVCEMRITSAGEVSHSRFYPAVMRSHARLIYEQVAAFLEHPKNAKLARRQPQLKTALKTLDEVFEALLAARNRRGAIDFQSTETQVVFGADRKIEAIVPRDRTRAHRIIEESMIAANVEAAKFVGAHEIPAPFRVHAAPEGQKVAQLREFLNARGLSLPGGAIPDPADYAHTVASLGQREDAGLIQQMMLRSMMQARYAATDDGHFGLALEHYAHFTSPIRRYPDLLLHRAIKHAVARRKPGTAPFSTQAIAELADHSSMAERRAEEATRDVMSWLKCEYMSHRIGETFDGIVTGVAAFGVFVELQGLYIDGMVHISRLGRDYFEYDARHHRVVGSRSGAVFALGTKLCVKLVRASLDDRKIDLEPVARD